eukprot:733859_1
MSQPILWNRTYVNLKNVQNVCLYIQRRTSHGTRPISVAPSDYLSQLQENNITIHSLNIPNICPQYDLTKTHHLSDACNRQMNETIRLLWNIIQSHIQIDSECHIRHIQSDQSAINLSQPSKPTDVCMNEKMDDLSSKMDRIVRACGIDTEYNHIQNIEVENDQLKSRNAKLEEESIECKQQMQNAQQTIDKQQRYIRRLQKERRNITNLKNYYKKVASKRRETLKCIGLVYKGNVVSMYGRKQLSRRIRFLACYMKEVYNVDTACVNQLLCKYVVMQKDVCQYLCAHVFFPQFRQQYEREIREFELNIS